MITRHDFNWRLLEAATQPRTGLRKARRDDAHFIHQLRQRRECQGQYEGWYGGQLTTYKEHKRWYRRRLRNRLVTMLIWEQNGQPTGYARIDSNGELAFDGPDEMLRHVRAYATQHGGRLKATVDQDDTQTIAQLTRAGFRTYPATFLAYKP